MANDVHTPSTASDGRQRSQPEAAAQRPPEHVGASSLHGLSSPDARGRVPGDAELSTKLDRAVAHGSRVGFRVTLGDLQAFSGRGRGEGGEFVRRFVAAIDQPRFADGKRTGEADHGLRGLMALERGFGDGPGDRTRTLWMDRMVLSILAQRSPGDRMALGAMLDLSAARTVEASRPREAVPAPRRLGGFGR